MDRRVPPLYGDICGRRHAQCQKVHQVPMKPALLPVLLGAIAGTVVAQLPAPKPIFDARLTLKPSSLTEAQSDLVKQRIAPAARKHWQEVGRAALCIPPQELRAIDVASGAFTRPQAEQQAILYSYCEVGHNADLDGIAIVEGGRVVAHLVFEGAANTAIGALPDLNGNGLAEIVIASGGTNMGTTWGALSIIEITGAEVTAFGHTGIFSDDCGERQRDCRVEAARILARPDAKPAFFRETYRRGGDAGAWKKIAAATSLTLEEDETEYELLR